MKTKKELKQGVLIMLMLASTASHAATDDIFHGNVYHVTIVTAPAIYHVTIVTPPVKYIETCKDHVCTQHRVSPEYFAIPARVPVQVTVQETHSTNTLFINPDGLPVPQYTGKHIPARDCIYHGHVLKPGDEVLRYDRKTGTHWHRICRDVNGNGVMSPAVD